MPGRIVETRTFDRRIRFHCPDARLADLMGSLSALPEMPPPRDPDLDIEIYRIGPAHYDFHNGIGTAPGTARFTYDRASKVMERTFVAEARAAVIVMAASMVVGGRRILVLGDGFERSRFVLECVAEGFSVETDRLVHLHGNSVSPMPIRPRIYAREAPRFPALAPAILRAPVIDDWDGNIVHAIEPCLPGQPWRIMPGPVGLILVLEPNSGGHSSAGRLSAEACFAALMGRMHRQAGKAAAEFAALHSFSRAAPCWKLRLGADDRWPWHIERMLNACAA